MRLYLVARAAQAAVVLFGITLITFFMIRLTGDPARSMLPRTATAEQVTAFRQRMGWDQPLLKQYLDYAAGALTGNFGTSVHFNRPAMGLLLERARPTVELACASILVVILVAVPLGVLAAGRQGSLVDAAAQLIALLGQSLPVYWVGLVLILVLAVRLDWLPVFGRGGWTSYVMPVVTMSLGSIGQLTRLTRSAMLEVLRQDYIRTAYAKGCRRPRVFYGHALRNAAIPLLTYLGVTFGYMLGGAVIIESVFAWPGIGQLAYQAVSVRDYPLVQAVAFTVSVTFVALNLAVDLAYAWLNPRIRYG
jgi:ABC-type dipeptide/oligopeptide/nickel transport system permease component